MDTLILYEEIGKGHQSTIYRGLWNNKEVAVKEHKDEDKHKKEKDMLMKLDHPNIIKLLDYNDKYLVLPLLCKIDKANKLDKQELKKFCKEMISAIYYLNQHNIGHYDVNIGNIMKEGDKYILCDFGISKYKSKYGYLGSCPFTGSLDPLFFHNVESPDMWDLGKTVITLLGFDIEKYLYRSNYTKLIDEYDKTYELSTFLNKMVLNKVQSLIKYEDKLLIDWIKSLMRLYKRSSLLEAMYHPWITS